MESFSTHIFYMIGAPPISAEKSVKNISLFTSQRMENKQVYPAIQLVIDNKRLSQTAAKKSINIQFHYKCMESKGIKAISACSPFHGTSSHCPLIYKV